MTAAATPDHTDLMVRLPIDERREPGAADLALVRWVVERVGPGYRLVRLVLRTEIH